MEKMNHPAHHVKAAPRRSDEPDPRRARSQDRLLDAATELLATGGLDAVTVDSVTRRSGVARTTLYRNFGNITELLASAFERLIPQIDPASEAESLRDQLIEVLVRKAAVFEQAPLQWALFTWSGHQHTTTGSDAASPAAKSPAMQSLRSRLISHYRQPFDRIIESTEGHAKLGEIDSTLAVAQLLGPIVFIQLSGQRPITSTDCEQIVDDFLAAHTQSQDSPICRH